MSDVRADQGSSTSNVTADEVQCQARCSAPVTQAYPPARRNHPFGSS